MPRPREQTILLDNMMFTCMRKHNFAQEATIKEFGRALRKKGITMSLSSRYKWYDKIAGKIDLSGSFQQNINQFFADLTKVASKSTRKYLAADDQVSGYALDEYLRVAQLQKEALNLQQTKSGDNNSLFMQFVQQNNNQEVNVNEVLTNIQEGLGEFGPLLARLNGAPQNTGGGPILTIPAESKTKDTHRKH